VLLEKKIEATQGMPLLICSMMVINGIFLFIVDQFGRGVRSWPRRRHGRSWW